MEALKTWLEGERGRVSWLAAELSKLGLPISQPGLSQWTRVPPERVLHVEQLTGISRYVLSPEIFGTGAKEEHAESAA